MYNTIQDNHQHMSESLFILPPPPCSSSATLATESTVAASTASQTGNYRHHDLSSIILPPPLLKQSYTHVISSVVIDPSSDSYSSLGHTPEHMFSTPIDIGSYTPLLATPNSHKLSSVLPKHVISSSSACVYSSEQDAVTYTFFPSDGGPGPKEGQVASESVVKEKPLLPNQTSHLTEGTGGGVPSPLGELSLVDNHQEESVPPSTSVPPNTNINNNLHEVSDTGLGLGLGSGLGLGLGLGSVSSSTSTSTAPPLNESSLALLRLGLDPTQFYTLSSLSKGRLTDYPPLPHLGNTSHPLSSVWDLPPFIPSEVARPKLPLLRSPNIPSPIYSKPISPLQRTPLTTQFSTSLLLTTMIASHMSDRSCLRLRGGGPPARAQLSRAAKKALPTLPAHSPLINYTPLPIPQLTGMQMAVADSTLAKSNKGLFTLIPTDTDELLCMYTGTRIRDHSIITNEAPRFDYLWSNRSNTLTIDAYLALSCYGRYANDALYENKCNAVIEERHGKIYLISTRPLAANEEIFVNYGDGYWADRFHKFRSTTSSELSEFQTELIKAYHLVPLPDGTAITQRESKTKKSADTPSSLLPVPTQTLSSSKHDILLDTYGSSKHLSLALSLSEDSTAHLHTLIFALMSNPLALGVGILKKFLQEYNETAKLRIWKKKDRYSSWHLCPRWHMWVSISLPHVPTWPTDKCRCPS